MHIPAAESTTLSIEPFDRALKEAKQQTHIRYDVRDWLYVPNHYTEYRYILGTTGKQPLICIGINPSTAAPNDLDPTLKSVERIAKNNGYDSFIMFNVYAQRATRPNDMDRTRNETLHRENMRAFDYILSLCENGQPAVWAAWGNIVEQRPYLPDCVREMVRIGQDYGGHWLRAGKCSNKGHPHHPLYLRRDEVTRTLDVEGYLTRL